ncbi:MAG TPA: STAS domain-containing protein [Actinomycetales bacterium]|nr:STAS domain-containing protein [Actinomycetales bacterium]
MTGDTSAPHPTATDGLEPFAGDVSVFFDPTHTLILLRGDIDLAVAADLEDAGRDAIDAKAPIIADVRAVNLIDSVGISFLVRLAASGKEAGTTVSLRGPAPRVAELLTLVGANDLFVWEDEAAGGVSA